MKTILSFFQSGTNESSVRLIFILTAFAVLYGVIIIDTKFAFGISKYSGVEIAAVLTANCAFLVSVIYGKNKAKELEV